MKILKNIPIIVVEDEFLHKETIINNLKNLGYSTIYEASNSNDAIRICTEKNIVLAFIDIGLSNSNLDGIALAKELNKISNCIIIFTTSYSDNTTLERIKDVKFQEYILKPVDERRLFVAIDLAFSKLESIAKKAIVSNTSSSTTSEDIFVKGNTKYFNKISVEDIIYIKAELGGINIVTIDKTQFTYSSLSDFIAYFNHPDILKIHRSFAVNKKHVIGKSESELKMIDGTILPIGNKQKPNVDKHFLVLKNKSR